MFTLIEYLIFNYVLLKMHKIIIPFARSILSSRSAIVAVIAIYSEFSRYVPIVPRMVGTKKAPPTQNISKQVFADIIEYLISSRDCL